MSSGAATVRAGPRLTRRTSIPRGWSSAYTTPRSRGWKTAPQVTFFCGIQKPTCRIFEGEETSRKRVPCSYQPWASKPGVLVEVVGGAQRGARGVHLDLPGVQVGDRVAADPPRLERAGPGAGGAGVVLLGDHHRVRVALRRCSGVAGQRPVRQAVGVVMDQVVQRGAVGAGVLDVVALPALVGVGHQDGSERVGHVVDGGAAATGDQCAARAVELDVVGGEPARRLGHREVAGRGVPRHRGHGEVHDVDAEARARQVGVLAVVERALHAAGRVAGAVGDARGEEVEAEIGHPGVHLADDRRGWPGWPPRPRRGSPCPPTGRWR